MGTANHRVEVVRIAELEKHPNADSLSLVRVGGYQVVVRTEEWKVGDLAIYIQPDSVVPQEPQYAFLWEGMTFPDDVVPEKRRRITVRRFRKEYSEGMLMHLSDLPLVKIYDEGKTTVLSYGIPKHQPMQGWGDFTTVEAGMDLAEFLHITHYEPPEDPQSTLGDNERGPGRKQSKIFPRSLKGWMYFLVRVFTFGLYDLNGNVGGANTKAPDSFRPIYDVESIKNFGNVLQEGEQVVATEKIHGSNARYTFDGKMYAGSRKLWKSPTSNCIWRTVLAQHPWVEEWCRAHEGYTLYGEVVPTQDDFDYGCKNGEVKFFVFDILTPEGKWVNRLQVQPVISIPSDHWVPTSTQGAYVKDAFQLLADGLSLVPGAKHIREGIVIRPAIEREARNLGRVQLKIVSNKFLEKDSK